MGRDKRPKSRTEEEKKRGQRDTSVIMDNREGHANKTQSECVCACINTTQLGEGEKMKGAD